MVATSHTFAPPGSARPAVVTVATAGFAMVFIQAILSYPASFLCPSGLYDLVESHAGGPGYMLMAYNSTLVCFSLLLVLYRVLPTRMHVEAFQRKPFEELSQLHYQRVWRWVCALILVNCAIMFYQAEYVLPLARSFSMDFHDYGLYRAEVTDGVNGTIANLTLHLLVPVVLFISFKCMPSTAIENRMGSILVTFLAASFSLSRVFMATVVVVLVFANLACTPAYFRLRHAYRGALIVTALVSMVLGFMALSTQGYFQDVLGMFFDRTIHGQWLGLPLYFYYFEDHPGSATSFLHPALRSALGIEITATPGRELMEYFQPHAAEQGTAGVIPTFFIGEAYAVAGWTGAGLAVLYVSIMLWFITYAMSRMKKTYWSCCLYGWIMYKFSTGLMLGISAFLTAGLLVVVLLLLMWLLFADIRTVVMSSSDGDPRQRSLSRRGLIA